jgi:putative peptide zinc metalloprotease protein
VICRSCRRQRGREGACPSCGAFPTRAVGVFDLILEDGTRVPLVRDLTIGRAPGNAVQLVDPAVSRAHALIAPSPMGGGPVLRDTGSSHGTRVDGRIVDGPVVLRDGARVVLGDRELVVERRRDAAEAGRTILVPPGASVVIPSLGTPRIVSSSSAGRQPGDGPRLRSGYALKRLESAEGTRRWVLKDLVGRQTLRLTDADAGLVRLLDGRRSMAEITGSAGDQLGPAGAARLAVLVADLASRGLLDGASAASQPEAGRFARLVRPHQWTWSGAGSFLDGVYLRGGWLLFTRPLLATVATMAVAGLVAFGYLVAARYGTPFVVASKIGLGGIVFIAGRAALAAAHEVAHGLAMASFGRRVTEAGVKLVLVFPYTFVDTSDMWFEPRRRRMAVSAAGPACDLALGGGFALACLFAPVGTLRDILFQLAFGAYYGALFNLNPLLERDGYHVLVDAVQYPGLRRHALDQLRRRLAGGGTATDSRLLDRYAVLVVAWMVAAAGFAALLSLHFLPTLAALVPRPTAWALLATLWAGLLAPPLLIVLPALRQRRRRGAT